VIVVAISVRVLFRPHANSVYPIFAQAAAHWMIGEDLYQPAADVYRYSPLVAALFVPFRLLPDAIGGILWRWLNVAVYLAAFGWASRSVFLTAAPPKEGRLALLFLLLVPLSVGSINNGQSNSLVLGLLLATIAAAATKRWNLASSCVALACLFKVYPISVGLLLAAIYPRRFAGRLMIALAIGLAVPFVLQRPAYVWDQYQGWLHHLLGDDRQFLPLEYTYRDIRLLCRLCSMPLSVGVYTAVQLVSATMLAAYCVWQIRRGESERFLLFALFGFACCWMTLLGSATESATYVLLAPVLAWLMMDAWHEPRPLALRLAVLTSFVLFTATQVAAWFPFGRRFHALGLHPAAALILLGCLVYTVARRHWTNHTITGARIGMRPGLA
jgi:hypothetical protein